MKTFIALFLCVAMISILKADQPCSDQEHSRWVVDTLGRIETIRPGATRGDLEAIFEVDGGLSSPNEQTYIYRQCNYIKVDVKFSLNSQGIRAKDTITSITKPYLARPQVG